MTDRGGKQIGRARPASIVAGSRAFQGFLVSPPAKVGEITFGTVDCWGYALVDPSGGVCNRLDQEPPLLVKGLFVVRIELVPELVQVVLYDVSAAPTMYTSYAAN